MFVAAVSTSATLMGAARRLRDTWPGIRVVAVDAQGSVIFGGAAEQTSLPGIGSSRTPELLCEDEIDEVLYVDDFDSARGCRELLRGEGILAERLVRRRDRGGAAGRRDAAADRARRDRAAGPRRALHGPRLRRRLGRGAPTRDARRRARGGAARPAAVALTPTP